MAQRAGGRRATSPTTRRAGATTLDARAGHGARRRDQPGVRAGPVPGRAARCGTARRRSTENFRTGGGIAWGAQHPCLFEGTERFFRAGYIGNLMTAWIPALDGVKAKLEARREGGRRGLRPRRLDDPDGEGVPEVEVLRLRLARRVDRDRAATRGAGAGVADRVIVRGRQVDRLSRAAATTSWRTSTASTTWRIPWAPRSTCADARRGRHVDDRRAVRRATRPRRTTTRSGASSTRRRRCSACRTRSRRAARRSARRRARRACATWS